MSATAPAHTRGHHDPVPVRIYCALVSLGFVVAISPFILSEWRSLNVHAGTLISFALLAAAADCMRVRVWNSMSFALSMPFVLAAGIVLEPWQAGIVGFLASLDIAEFRNSVPISRAIFNRSEVGLSVLGASIVFHAFGPSFLEWPAVLVAALVALAIDFLCNVLLVVYPVAALNESTFVDVVRRMVQPEPTLSVAIYVGLGLMAPLIAEVWEVAGSYGVAVFLLPLGLARLTYGQAQELNVATARIQEKNRAIMQTLEDVADERRDERLTISGELHDEVLPPLFKVHLMGEVLRQDLNRGQLLQLDEDLPELLSATHSAQVAVRELVRDLRRSALGTGGLATALRTVARNLESAGSAPIRLVLLAFTASRTAELIAYQAAREAMTNASRYARSSAIEVRAYSDENLLRVTISDDGIGFDPHGVDAELHFGLQLMRERVEAAGGRLVLDSRMGLGTTVSISVPRDL
jgi:signal transduction histidine kinase